MSGAWYFSEAALQKWALISRPHPDTVAIWLKDCWKWLLKRGRSTGRVYTWITCPHWALCLVVKLKMDEISNRNLHYSPFFFFFPKWGVHNADLTRYLDKQCSGTDTIRYKPCPQHQKEKDYTHDKNVRGLKKKMLFLRFPDGLSKNAPTNFFFFFFLHTKKRKNLRLTPNNPVFYTPVWKTRPIMLQGMASFRS